MNPGAILAIAVVDIICRIHTPYMGSIATNAYPFQFTSNLNPATILTCTIVDIVSRVHTPHMGVTTTDTYLFQCTSNLNPRAILAIAVVDVIARVHTPYMRISRCFFWIWCAVTIIWLFNTPIPCCTPSCRNHHVTYIPVVGITWGFVSSR